MTKPTNIMADEMIFQLGERVRVVFEGVIVKSPENGADLRLDDGMIIRPWLSVAKIERVSK